MTAADMVNLILEKFRTGKVVFLMIEDDYTEVIIGPQRYWILSRDDDGLQAFRMVDMAVKIDAYSKWVEGVLNGKTRDENGVLS